jgi:hypothetical protein
VSFGSGDLYEGKPTAPRDPGTWVPVKAQPVPDWALDYEVLGKALSGLGKTVGPGLIDKARALGATLPPELDRPPSDASMVSRGVW